MLELLFELLAQFFVEVIVQGGLECAFRGLAEPFRHDRPPVFMWAIFSYCVCGAVGGGLSVWLWPMQVLKHPAAQYANLIVTPLVLGLVFEWIGRRREAEDKDGMLLDHFAYGFAFALMMGLVRFFFAQ